MADNVANTPSAHDIDSVVGPGAAVVQVNPYGFLAAEEAVRDQQAAEALFLTYNVDLGFLEARLLGLCQAAGARVTVIADANVWQPDLRAVRHAGRSYHVGLFGTRANFHPKVMVLAGPKRAVAVIGSGNLTLGGWQYNAELATVFTGDLTGMPTAFADIRDLLASLAQSDAVDPLAREGVERTIVRLDALLRQAPPVASRHRVVASWDGPLIDHLPRGPVSELLLSAPFHDPRAEAVRELLARFKPRIVRLAVQPGWTLLDTHALAKVLDDYSTAAVADVQVVTDTSDPNVKGSRYRHGKLVEWVNQDGERWSLTGSPNLSVAALLRDTNHGGNHEVAVIGPLASSLFPGGDPISLDTVPDRVTLEPSADDVRREGTPLLSYVVRIGNGLHIRLARPTTGPVDVELSHRADSPDLWVTISTLTAGVHEADINLDGAAAGSRVRLVWTDVTGQIAFGQPVFLTDPDRVRQTPMRSNRASRTTRAESLDLFSDDLALLNALSADLTAFADDLASTRGPQASRIDGADTDATDESESSGRHHGGAEPWLWLQDDTISKYGPGLASFALALPHVPGDITGSAIVAWADKLTDEAEVGLEDDTAEAIETDPTLVPESEQAIPPPLDHTDDTERLRSARRRWTLKASALAPALGTPSRLLILRVTLSFWSAGNWNPGDPEPSQHVATLLRSLDRAGTPIEMEQRIGSLAAIALTMLRDRVDLSTHNQFALHYRRVVDDVTHLLLATDSDLITEYSRGLANMFGSALAPEDVLDTVNDLTSGDDLAEVADNLEDDGYDVARPGPGLLHIQGKFTNPELIALNAVGQVEERPRIGVWASNHHGDWALVAWRQPDLITVTQRRGLTRWRHRRLPALYGPAALALDLRMSGGGASTYDIATTPRHRPTDVARDVLAAVGIIDVEPPALS